MALNLTKSVTCWFGITCLPSSEEKHKFRYELALASRYILQSVVDVVGSLP